MPRGRPPGSKNKPVLKGTSKGTKKNTKLQEVVVETYKCTSCGRIFNTQRGKFYKSPSPMWSENNGYITVCNDCIGKYETQYMDILGDSEQSTERLCQIFGWYVNENILEQTRRVSSTQPRIGNVISKSQISPHTGKVYEDRISEGKNDSIDTIEDIKELNNNKITSKTLKFWGAGYTQEDYLYLNDKYDDWISRHECKTKAQESIFQKICLMELQITKAIQKGDKVEGLMKAYNDLLGSANVKPVQTNDNTLADQNTFGTLIQKWENEKPIPEPDPEWKDVDGIIKYVSVWFLGHLCKMMNIKNRYSRLYDEEMSKYTVDKPQYEEDTETVFEDIFGSGRITDNTSGDSE